jgi:hypothetical protein
MPRKRSEVDAALLRKGFRNKEGDHHYFIYYTTAGKKTRVFTKTSHSHREISDNLLSQMAQQCKLARANFDRLLDCPLSREEYERLLLEREAISP